MFHRHELLFALSWSWWATGVLGLPAAEDPADMRMELPSHLSYLNTTTKLHFYADVPVSVGPSAAPDKNTPCRDYHNLNTSSEKCEFIKSNEDCQNSDGFINYLQVIYCTFPNLRPLAFICLSLWLVYLLIILGVTAEDFFCPNLDVMAQTLKMSQNIAGVTLLAFGNGAPDIFSAVAAITNSRDGEAGLAIGALFGAAMFVTTVVAGSIAVTRPFKMVERPFLRDTIFFLATVFWVFYVLYRGRIKLLEAIGFLLLFFSYVTVVFVGRKIFQHHKKKKKRRQEQEEASETYPNLGPGDHFPSLNPSINSTIIPSINSYDVYPADGTLPQRGDFSATERLAAASLIGVDREAVRSITPQPHRQYQPDGRGDDTQPLLESEAPHDSQLKELFMGLCPLNMKKWKEIAWYSKVWEIIKCPMIFCFNATIPVVDYDEPKHNWNRLLNSLNIFLAPIFCAFVTKGLTKTITGDFAVWHLLVPLAFVLAVLVLLTSKPSKQPFYQPLFAYVGFIVAALWIFSAANEIVNILQMFGLEFYINDAILGLTILAWGNSVADLVADVAMAKQGFPTMGMSACFGGPLFNMLVGIGVSCTIVTIRDGGTFVLVTNHVQYVLAMGVAASLLSSMFIMLITRFHVTRWYGIYLYILYGTFLITAVLVELHVIPW